MRFKLMGEGFGGIKDALSVGSQKIFSNRFQVQSQRFATAQGCNASFGSIAMLCDGIDCIRRRFSKFMMFCLGCVEATRFPMLSGMICVRAV